MVCIVRRRPHNTDDLPEGTSNLYFTDGRVSANADVAANTAHRTSDGTDHSYIDQDVTTAGTPTFEGVTAHNRISVTDSTNVYPLQVTSSHYKSVIATDLKNDAPGHSYNQVEERIFLNNDANDNTWAFVTNVRISPTAGAETSWVQFRVADGGAGVTALDLIGQKVRCWDEVEIDGDLNHDGSKVGFYGVTPKPQPDAYTLNHVTEDRTLDADSTTVAELADVLGTLISDLKSIGLLQ